MVLIVDSGSTKSDWLLIEKEEITKEFKTIGFNPFFHDKHKIASEIDANKGLKNIAEDISSIFYYGAGCSSDALKAIVHDGLKMVFPQAEISVDHDLAACAYATYTGVPAISCILGTGSNSCFFDGFKMEQAVPSLAYILGDEASGSYFGKRLLRDFLYKLLPEHIEIDFKEEFALTKDKIFKRIYGQPNANVFLATFMKFIFKHKEDPYFQNILFKGFNEFLSIHVMSYKNYNNVPVHFIGSVAYFFQNELKTTCENLDIQVGQIIRKPILGLVAFHKEQGQLS